MTVRITVVDHPVVADALATIRAATTGTAEFAAGIDRIAAIAVTQATAELPTTAVTVHTPLTAADGERLSATPVIVPVLRAGLAMVEAVRRVLPSATVGMIGMARDESTHQAAAYLERLPDDIGSRPVIVTEPMIATGGSLVDVISRLRDAGARGTITVMSLLAAPEGIDRLRNELSDVHVVVAAIDDHLDDNAYIVPGLGDAGDRAYGTI